MNVYVKAYSKIPRYVHNAACNMRGTVHLCRIVLATIEFGNSPRSRVVLKQWVTSAGIKLSVLCSPSSSL